jgi:hypothetical protein
MRSFGVSDESLVETLEHDEPELFFFLAQMEIEDLFSEVYPIGNSRCRIGIVT